MKPFLLLTLTSAILAPISSADQIVGYPEKKPVIDLSFPDKWEVKYEDGALLAIPSEEDDSFIVAVTPMEAGVEDPQAAIKEAKEAIEEKFEGVKYEELQKVEGDGVVTLLVQGKGKDDSGAANIASAIISRPDAEHLYLMELISTPEGFTNHSEAGLKLIKTLKPHGAAGPVQTYSYPDKTDPVYAIDFPADWKMEPEAESVYVVSPDKLVAVNALLIDQGELAVAVGKLKESTGSRFDSIEWKKEPGVQKDEKLGVTAKFHSGTAKAGDQEISVNIAEYVRAKGDKFLVIICQHPVAALDVHGDAIEKMVQSVKVK
jgi:hypothetical protein